MHRKARGAWKRKARKRSKAVAVIELGDKLTNSTPGGDLEINTFIGEHDPSWGSPLLGQVSFISGVDLSDTDEEAYRKYKDACSALSDNRRRLSTLRSI